MPYLHTDCQIVIELITRRTTAFVTANRIDAGSITARRRVAFILVYTLIVIKVLHKAIRASAAVTSHKILKKIKSVFFRKKKMPLDLFLETEDVNIGHYCKSQFIITKNSKVVNNARIMVEKG